MLIYYIWHFSKKDFRFRRYALPSKPDPESFSELKDDLSELVQYGYFRLDKELVDFDILIERPRTEPTAFKRNLVGFARVHYSPKIGEITIKSLRMTPEFREVLDEYYLLEKGKPYPDPPPLYPKWEVENFDPRKSPITQFDKNVGYSFAPFLSYGGQRPSAYGNYEFMGSYRPKYFRERIEEEKKR